MSETKGTRTKVRKYELEDVTIEKVAAGKQNAGKEYVKATAFRDDNFFADPETYTDFEERRIARMKEFIPVSKGGTQQTDTPLPDKMRFIYGYYDEFFPPCGQFHKQYLQADERGRYKEGDLVSRNGIPVVYESIRIFVMTDQDGDPLPRKSLAEEGMRQFNNYCVPIQRASPEDTIIPKKPETEKKAEKVITGYDPKTGQPIYAEE